MDDARYTTPMAQVLIRHVKYLSLFTDNSINQSLPLITKMSKELSFFPTNSNFLIPISMQADGVNL